MREASNTTQWGQRYDGEGWVGQLRIDWIISAPSVVAPSGTTQRYIALASHLLLFLFFHRTLVRNVSQVFEVENWLSFHVESLHYGNIQYIIGVKGSSVSHWL